MDAVRFIARPAPYTGRHGWSGALVWALAVIFLFDLALDWAVWLAIEKWDAATDFLPAPLEEGIPFVEELFFALLIAPVLEEAVYRGWLTGRIAALRFAAFGFAAEACFIGSLWVEEQWAMPLAIAGGGAAFIGFAQWLHTRERDTAIPAWFTRNFHWLVWGSSLFFALIHLGNYESITHPLGVLVVAPQLIGGLLLAYVRTRLGLRAAMVHHAAYNALFLALEPLA
jgi:membrane protease YdiL (CAAX protease family)